MSNCNCNNIKEEYQTFKNGTRHLRQTCRDCNKFLGFKQQPLADDFVMPFGKHKGKLFKDLDIGYLEWLIKQDWVKENMLIKANTIIETFEKV